MPTRGGGPLRRAELVSGVFAEPVDALGQVRRDACATSKEDPLMTVR